ncbi:MAG TPA: 50S ribosomal protein L11 [Candidatus Saccharimonadales bacterium]|nr:50S ribosomal protein L11 [Candidatus Saccharimonadales bacterium]
MALAVKANLKMRLPAGRASAGPPVGSILGQHGLNLMEFVQAFNDQTKDMMGKDVIVHVKVFENRTMNFEIIGQPVDDMIREAAKIDKGSGKPHTDKVGKITMAQVREIAEKKMAFLNANDVDAAAKTVAGTARSMGVEVVE